MSLKWIKIDEAGIDFEKQEWAAREMVANNLTWTTKVPRSLSPGNYVFRHETIAVHGSLRIGGAQNYPQCFNVEITGSGTASPEGTLAAELYTPTDPGIFFNPYKKPILNYTIPGPALFTDEGHDESSNATRPKTYSAVNSSVVLSTPTAPAVHRTILMSGTHSEGKTSLYASTVDPATTATPTAEILEISSTPSVSIETTLPTAYLAPKVSATSTDAAELSKGTGEQAGNSAIDGAAVSSDTWTLESIIAWLQNGSSYSQTGFNASLTLPSSQNILGNPAFPGWTTTGGLNWLEFLATEANSTLTYVYNFASGGATSDSTIIPQSSPGDVGNAWSWLNYTTLIPKIIRSRMDQTQALYDFGGRDFIILNIPPINQSPLMLSKGETVVRDEGIAIDQYNHALSGSIRAFKAANPDANVHYVDTTNAFWKVLKNPEAFGARDANCFDDDGLTCLWWNNNPRIEDLVPRSVNTVRDWIMQAASDAKITIEKSLRQSASSITISFDDWTANNGLDFLGVTAHYLDASLNPRAILLGLRDTRGSHSGDSIAEEVLRVIHDYDMGEKVRYFMADNASANDRAIKVLSESLEIDPQCHRIMTDSDRPSPLSVTPGHLKKFTFTYWLSAAYVYEDTKSL
ncbi:hypothetical protein MBLNU13_g10314t2 [Cladosporium sp. NU13]